MGRETEQRILASGLSIASERGLNGVSLGILAERSGLSKSGLFAHFGSKEDLQLRLLKAAEAALRRHVVEPATAASAGLPRLLELMRLWLGWAARAGLPGGCPLYAAAFELDDADGGPVRDYLVSSHRQWMATLTSLVQEAVDLHHLPAGTDAAQVAWELNGIYLAHHVRQRLIGDRSVVARAQDALQALLGTDSLNPGNGPESPS